MLRRDGVHHGGGFVQIAHLDQRAPALHGGENDVATRHGFHQSSRRRRRRIEEGRIGGNQNRLRLFVVFGLRE